MIPKLRFGYQTSDQERYERESYISKARERELHIKSERERATYQRRERERERERHTHTHTHTHTSQFGVLFFPMEMLENPVFSVHQN
jgi:hypothetical protein